MVAIQHYGVRCPVRDQFIVVSCQVMPTTRVVHGVQVMTYDGGNQGVFNSNGTYFYTHEVMESYIGSSMCGQITHSGFFRTHNDGILKTMDLHALEGDSIWRALLARPSAVERNFITFDFITLQKIDYRDLYRCRCAFQESLQSQIARATPDHGHERTHSGSDDVPGRPSACVNKSSCVNKSI